MKQDHSDIETEICTDYWRTIEIERNRREDLSRCVSECQFMAASIKAQDVANAYNKISEQFKQLHESKCIKKELPF